MLSSALSPAQDSDDESIVLIVTGIETIDPKERISGDATVGVNYLHKRKDDSEEEEDIFQNVWAYFEKKPTGNLKTQVTTVDGRYLFRGTTPTKALPNLKGKWGMLSLERTDNKPLSVAFLKGKYDRRSDIAVLVTDHENYAFPVSWGKDKSDAIRIHVNAEGADAYFIRYGPCKNEAELRKCATASEDSQFKFDHNCDMRVEDIGKLMKVNSEVQIIRKRGATFDKSITVKISVPPPNPDATDSSKDCDEKQEK